MKWRGRQQSSNVEDRRGKRVRRTKRAGGVSIVGIIIAIIYTLVTGNSPMALLQNNSLSQQTKTEYSTTVAANEDFAEFSKVVLKDTEDVWDKLFKETFGEKYTPPKMVIFNGETEGRCGYAGTTTGPYYCPADQTVYLDLNFLRDMGKKFGATGDFAPAYVIAHEVGHHIQNLMGTLRQVHQQKQSLNEVQANKLNVKLELQADFYAGVWAHHAQKMKNILDPGDIEEGIRAAGSVGDDKLQMKAQGRVVPDAFTHGSAKQRTEWFMRGLKSGNIKEGNTFSVL